MQCCGSDRKTPFCPLCGKALGNTSPLVELMKYCSDRQREWEKKLEEHDIYHSPTSSSGQKERANVLLHAQKWKRWAEAIEVAIKPAGEQAAICADWLSENGMQEASECLRAAFN